MWWWCTVESSALHTVEIGIVSHFQRLKLLMNCSGSVHTRILNRLSFQMTCSCMLNPPLLPLLYANSCSTIVNTASSSSALGMCNWHLLLRDGMTYLHIASDDGCISIIDIHLTGTTSQYWRTHTRTLNNCISYWASAAVTCSCWKTPLSSICCNPGPCFEIIFSFHS